MSDLQAQSRVLLTGAGFTHNFGAPMASEMWAKILNRLPRDGVPEVRRRLLRDQDGKLDFEAAYQEVMSSEAFYWWNANEDVDLAVCLL